MRRPVVMGLLLGALNGSAAAVALYALGSTAPPGDVGWTAYAPLDRSVVPDGGFPWEYVVVPGVLVVLNALLLPLALRRGWLHR